MDIKSFEDISGLANSTKFTGSTEIFPWRPLDFPEEANWRSILFNIRVKENWRFRVIRLGDLGAKIGFEDP